MPKILSTWFEHAPISNMLYFNNKKVFYLITVICMHRMGRTIRCRNVFHVRNKENIRKIQEFQTLASILTYFRFFVFCIDAFSNDSKYKICSLKSLIHIKELKKLGAVYKPRSL